MYASGLGIYTRFALVKECSRPERCVLRCIHHKAETKDWRKIPKESLETGTNNQTSHHGYAFPAPSYLAFCASSSLLKAFFPLLHTHLPCPLVLSLHLGPRWPSTTTRRKPTLLEPATLPLSARIVPHPFPLPLLHDLHIKEKPLIHSGRL